MVQAVDHPYLVVHSATGANARENFAAAASSSAPAAAAADADVNMGMCGICHDPLEQPVLAGCGHAFCRVCLGEYLDGCGQGQAASCPSCQRPLSVDLSAAAGPVCSFHCPLYNLSDASWSPVSHLLSECRLPAGVMLRMPGQC